MKHFIRLILLFFMLCSVSVQADMRIVITKGVNTARPIAIIPFSWSGSGQPPENLNEIIANDLQNSGKFNPIDKKNMPEIPTSADDINSALWAKKGIDSVIMGSVKLTEDGQFLISYKMIDTVTSPGATLAENQFVVSHQWLRYAAHTISDEVFERLTGIKGAFRTRIAYIVKMNKSAKYTHELRVSDYDGFGQITLHRSNAPLMSPAWSVDGKKIAFVTFEGGHSSLVLKTLATGELETIASYPRHNGAPAFSPDGKKLAFVLSKDGSLNLYVMDLATKRIKQITMGRSNNTEPSWMPDSEHIVYTSDQAGNPQVYDVNINTLAIQRLTWDGSQNQNAVASPDGKFIIMIRTDNGRQNVARLDLDSGAVQILADTFLDETPSLSPNGIMVIYSSSQGLGNILQLVSTDGRFKARLPATDGQITFPAWSPYL